MKNFRKYLILFFILLFESILLTGCRKRAVSENQLKIDLSDNSAYTMYRDDLNLSIDTFEVLKRQTAPKDRIDTAWVELDSSSDTVTCQMYFKMTYELYNDGWKLTNVEEDDLQSWNFTPLCGVSDEEIQSYIPDDAEIISNSIDLEQGIDTIVYTYTDSHKYCDITYKNQILFEFGSSMSYYDVGKWIFIDVKDAGSYETWDIIGKWQYTESSESHYQEVNLEITDFPSDNILLDESKSDNQFDVAGSYSYYYGASLMYHPDYSTSEGPFEAERNYRYAYLGDGRLSTNVLNVDYPGYLFNVAFHQDILVEYDKITFVSSSFGRVDYAKELTRIE